MTHLCSGNKKYSGRVNHRACFTKCSILDINQGWGYETHFLCCVIFSVSSPTEKWTMMFHWSFTVYLAPRYNSSMSHKVTNLRRNQISAFGYKFHKATILRRNQMTLPHITSHLFRAVGCCIGLECHLTDTGCFTIRVRTFHDVLYHGNVYT